MLKISTAPHLNAPQSTQSIMRDVIIALIPAGIVSVCVFGLSALIVILTSVAGCVAIEYFACKKLLHCPPTTWDLSAIVTGLLLAYNLPAGFPIWMTLIGCLVAVGLTKMTYGGIGKNIFNPALAGRVFLFISFPVEMTTWLRPHLFDFMNTDMQTGATTLSTFGRRNISHGIDTRQHIGTIAGLSEYVYRKYRRQFGRNFNIGFVAGIYLYAVSQNNIMAYSGVLCRHIFCVNINTLVDNPKSASRNFNPSAFRRTNVGSNIYGHGLHHQPDVQTRSDYFCRRLWNINIYHSLL